MYTYCTVCWHSGIYTDLNSRYCEQQDLATPLRSSYRLHNGHNSVLFGQQDGLVLTSQHQQGKHFFPAYLSVRMLKLGRMSGHVI